MKKNLVGIFLLFVFLFGCGGNTTQTNINSSANTNQTVANSNKSSDNTSTPSKTYAQMSEDEKTKFISEQTNKILDTFGRAEGDKANDVGLKMIKEFVDTYIKKPPLPKSDKCTINNDLVTILTRGADVAKMLNSEFKSLEVPSYIGIYLPMIESEYCSCLQAPTGGMGMFQFTPATGAEYGLKITKGATPASPDDRCDPKLSAQAAAKYIKFIMTKELSTKMNAIGYPLAISAYNSGEASLKMHITDVKTLTKNENVSFWTLLENENSLPKDAGYSKQFQAENKKYVPKFFAAAIIGENPRVFGVDASPLSAMQ